MVGATTLTVSNLSCNYGAIRAVRHVSLTVERGDIVALLGANGSGKSTTMKTIAGFHKPVTGTVEFDGTDVTRWPTHRLARTGLVYVPERPMSVLAALTVEENLALARYTRRGRLRDLYDRVFTIFPRLAERRSQLAGSMSGGEQQMVALGRALMANPTVMLVDSPVIGMSPAVADTVYESLLEINLTGVAILVIEQSAEVALTLASHAYVLNRGSVVLEGETATLRDSERLVEAYMN